MPSSPQKHSLDWDQPLLPQVTTRLLEYGRGEFIDLSDLLVVVPSSQSGRRLRESLALAAAKKGRGILPPEILTPDTALNKSLGELNVANDASTTAAWVEVLSSIDISYFDAVFPIEPIAASTWQLGMAQRFTELRNELGEEGLGFAETAKLAEEAGYETERWRQLARLEGLYFDQLKHRQLVDPKIARRDTAANYCLPKGIGKIILIATPDPQALPLRGFSQATDSTSLEIWTYGDSRLFDDWGRPVSEIWLHRSLELEQWGCQMQTLPDSKLTAQSIGRLAIGAEPESILIGLGDPDLNPLASDALTKQSIASYDPEGSPLNLLSLGRLCALLSKLSENANIQVIRSLIQQPDLYNWLQTDSTQAELLKDVDRCFENHLCADLDGLTHFAKNKPLYEALSKIKSVQLRLNKSKAFSTGMIETLQDIFADQEAPKDRKSSVPWTEQAEAIRKLLDELAKAEESFPKMSLEFSRTHFMQSLRSTRVYPDRPKEAHDLLGWLELLWNDAPHLVLAGINEGKVPESVQGDAFLPETLRKTLGLRTNEKRFARDAYILEALCRRRQGDKGQIDILVPQAAIDRTPLKPSRLLFQGAHDTLLTRTQQLFTIGSDEGTQNLHTLPWRLKAPEGLSMPRRLSVSALKNYLECPFRFFLRHILKMRTIDLETREMTPANFGTLFHDAVSHLAGLHLDGSLSRQDIENRLQSIAEKEMTKCYGRNLSFALRLQQEALVARISTFCQKQIEDIQDNGSLQITKTEDEFSMSIEGIEVRGVIDRIDKRGERVELIDYKTADKPKTPREAHLAVVARKEPPAHLPDAAFFEHSGKTYRWTDLQLPLYVRSQYTSGQELPSVAYFNIAKTLEKSGLSRWSEFTASHLESAESCAAAVIQQIKEGIFWPPKLDLRESYDDFAPLFPDGIENSVDVASFESYKFSENEA